MGDDTQSDRADGDTPQWHVVCEDCDYETTWGEESLARDDAATHEDDSGHTTKVLDDGEALQEEVAKAYRAAMDACDPDGDADRSDTAQLVNRYLLHEFAASRAGVPLPKFAVPEWAEPIHSLDIGFDKPVDADVLGDAMELVVSGFGEQEETGSYYTPEYVVEYIVEETVDPNLCREIEEYATVNWQEDGVDVFDVADSISADDRDAALDAIDDARILDPAAGSGHFLVDALDRVTEVRERIAPETETWRHYERTARNNIYGVDVLEIAIEMAKCRIRLRILETIPATEDGLPSEAVFE